MKTTNKLHKVSLSVLIALGMAVSPLALAQEEDLDELLEEDELEEVTERITVTGSRIRRAEFSSASPVQVIDGDVSRELGLFDTTEVLQTTTQAAGLQIDNTFSGFVLDNGPGSTNVAFRGLGADRTLVLVNGRRVAPSGAGGAPTAPDIGVIPGIMIQRVENLFDGASTTYGSDAIAGVANVILRKDFDGFEFQGNYSDPEADGANETTLSLMYGFSEDNHSFSIAGEYQERTRQTFAQSEFASDCDAGLWEDRDGTRYEQFRGLGPIGMPANNCDPFPLTNRIRLVDNFFGFLYRTPGFTNVGIPNYSESTAALYSDGLLAFLGLIPIDTNGDGEFDRSMWDGNNDGISDVNLQDPFWSFNQSERANANDWVSPTKRFSIFANGDYLFNDDNDTRFFYEGLYTRREANIKGTPTIFGDRVQHPVTNPFNPCGIDPINGQNCYAANNLDAFFGDRRLEVQPSISIIGDRDNTFADVYQYRLVAGLEGGLSFLEDIGAGNWSYEAHINYSNSKGISTQRGIVESRLSRSIENTVRDSETGDITCSPDCIPVNLFADSLYQAGGGYLTSEEEGFLFGTRFVDTRVKQTLISAYITGDAFTLPWNDEVVPVVLGWEWRKDEIETIGNAQAVSDNLWGFFRDRGATGERNLNEFFVETELPLLRGAPFAEELTLTAAARRTNESFYDAEDIWSIKGIYRPTTWLTIRGTRGTSFRAPNLRERFLLGQSGFAGVTDLCVVPDGARANIDPADPSSDQIYDETGETRSDIILDSCTATGVDPRALGLAVGGSVAVLPGRSQERFLVGTTDLEPERSRAETYGVIVENPFSEEFDLTFSITKYNIEITNAVVTPSTQFVLNQCYNNNEVAPGTSGYCANIRRDSDGFLDEVDVRSINVGFERTSGTDYNVYYNQDFLVSDKELGVVFDLTATKLGENNSEVLGNFDENLGEPSYPEWRINGRLSFSYDDFRLNWFTRYIGSGQIDNYDDTYFAETATFTPCDGLGIECRPVNRTSSYVVHNASIVYSQSDYQVTFGVQNIFNKEPPRVDALGRIGGVFQRRNLPLGVGYDTLGRTFFLGAAYRF